MVLVRMIYSSEAIRRLTRILLAQIEAKRQALRIRACRPELFHTCIPDSPGHEVRPCATLGLLASLVCSQPQEHLGVEQN